MKLDEPLYARGESGKQYCFYLLTKDSFFDKIGAVYIFIKEEVRPRRRYTPLYIGQTSNLQERIDEHEKWDCVNRHGCTHIAVKEVSHSKERLEIETDLRHAYSTKCNDQ